MGLFSSIGTFFGGPVGGLIGGVGDALLGRSDQKSAQSAEDARTYQANAWSERMSNTAYQRQMADLKQAGLNPILAARLGGASTPGVQKAQVLTPAMMQAQASTTQANTAKDLATSTVQVNKANIEKTSQEIDNLKATEKLTNEQKNQVSTTIEKIKAEIGLVGQNIKQVQAHIGKLKADTEMSQALATIPKIIEKHLDGMDQVSLPQKIEAVQQYCFGTHGLGQYDGYTGAGSNFNHQGSFARPNIR